MKKLFLLFLLLTSISTGVQAQTFSEICSTGQELEYRVSPTDVGDSERILLIDKRTGHKFEAKGDIILRDPEVKAMFPGGVDSLKKFLFENLEYPPIHGSFQGVVILEFVVETDGSITSINVLSSYCGGCQEYVNDAVRLVKAMPKWNPDQDDGQPCRSYYQLPITYCLR